MNRLAKPAQICPCSGVCLEKILDNHRSFKKMTYRMSKGSTDRSEAVFTHMEIF